MCVCQGYKTKIQEMLALVKRAKTVPEYLEVKKVKFTAIISSVESLLKSYKKGPLADLGKVMAGAQ
jgi:hypothetical protein